MSGFWLFLKFLPVVVFLAAPISVIITYGVAVAKDHVYPLFPYISDTGTKPPESCLFTFYISLIAFFIFCIAYVRYRQVSEFVRYYPSVRIKPVCNKAAFCLAIISAVSLHIVSSFQELHEFITHFVAAVVCFFTGTAYFVFQTLFTRRMYPEAVALFSIRLILTILCILCLFGTFGPVHCAVMQFKGDDVLKWTQEDGGYTLHLISTFSEWVLVVSFVSYMYTIFWDFRKFDLEAPVIKFKKPRQKGAPFQGHRRSEQMPRKKLQDV